MQIFFIVTVLLLGFHALLFQKNQSKRSSNIWISRVLFLEIDLFESTAKAEELKFNLEIKETSKKMFLSGEWDATSKLLENKDLIENKLNYLPYINFNNSLSYLKPNKVKEIPPASL